MSADPAEPRPAAPTSTFELRFSDGPFDEDHPVHDLSTLTLDGDHLWTAADERAQVERFRRSADDVFSDHRSFPLSDCLELPGGADGEMDIEGLDVDAGRLWVVGSHSLRRPKAEGEEEADRDRFLRRLAILDRQPNRFTLAALPLVVGAGGEPEPVAHADEADGGERRAAAVRWTRRGSRLTRALARDPHLAPFLRLPAKENGLDIEGLVVSGDRVLLGLRGPVLRGWAVVLELRAVIRGSRIKLRRLPDGLRYRKHFLDLHGLGVRDMVKVGDDLLILAGPSMSHAGRCAIFRWRDALAAAGPADGGDRAPVHVMELPSPAHVDRAEGLYVRRRGRNRLDIGIIYDKPARWRMVDADSVVRGDTFSVDRIRV